MALLCFGAVYRTRAPSLFPRMWTDEPQPATTSPTLKPQEAEIRVGDTVQLDTTDRVS